MRTTRLLLFLGILAHVLATLAPAGDISLTRHGSVAFATTVHASSGLCSWSGVRGVRKIGLWEGQIRSMEALMALVDSLPPIGGEPLVNASDYAVLTIKSRQLMLDTRRLGNSTALVEAFLTSFETLLSDNTVWTNPSYFNAASIFMIRLTSGGGSSVITGFKNSTCFWFDDSKELDKCSDLMTVWPQLTKFIAENITFFGFEQYPLLAPFSNRITVFWGAQNQTMSVPTNSPPVHLAELDELLTTTLTHLSWTAASSSLSDRGQTAAIACAVVFGVMTLAFIAIAILRYSGRQNKLLAPEVALQHAIDVYERDDGFNSDEEIFG